MLIDTSYISMKLAFVLHKNVKNIIFINLIMILIYKI